MKENAHCYTFEPHTYSDSLFEKGVDATYVIHLRNNGRYDSILKEVNTYKPTRTVYIVLNDGFKKCKKVFPQPPNRSDSLVPYDIVDATFQIFDHANRMKYKNILILEDDCFFSSEIRKRDVLTDLTTFFVEHESTPFSYRLGCIPYLMLPFFTHAPYGSYCAVHAYVVSRPYRDKAISTERSTLLHTDKYVNDTDYQYAYYKPLAYQLFTDTESRASWFIGLESMPFLISPCTSFINSMIHLFGLHVGAEPGYSIVYTLSKLLYSLLIVLVGVLVYAGIRLGQATLLKPRKRRTAAS